MVSQQVTELDPRGPLEPNLATAATQQGDVDNRLYEWGIELSAELASMIVAFVGVAGTLSGAVVTQRSALRGKQLDAEIQRRIAAETRQEQRQDAAEERRLTMFANLNAAARQYRTTAVDYILDLDRGPTAPTFERIEAARSAYRDLYARAQLTLSDPVLTFASEISNCLDRTYEALRELHAGDADALTADDLSEWLKGPLAEGIHLLPRAMRVDLGVSTNDEDIKERLRLLTEARRQMFAGRTNRHRGRTAG